MIWLKFNVEILYGRNLIVRKKDFPIRCWIRHCSACLPSQAESRRPWRREARNRLKTQNRWRTIGDHGGRRFRRYCCRRRCCCCCVWIPRWRSPSYTSGRREWRLLEVPGTNQEPCRPETQKNNQNAKITMES